MLKCCPKNDKMKNNKKNRERDCLNSFLSDYNKKNKSNHKELCSPDENMKFPLNVDFLCEDPSSGKIIAIDILGFHHSENLARGDKLVPKNRMAIENELEGKVKETFIAYIHYNFLNCSKGSWPKVKQRIIPTIIDETKYMKLGEERITEAYKIDIKKLSEDEEVVIISIMHPVYIGPGVGLSELINNIRGKNLKQFKSAKGYGYGTLLLIDDKRELLRADHPLVLRDFRDAIASIPYKEICYIDNIILRSRQENFYPLK